MKNASRHESHQALWGDRRAEVVGQATCQFPGMRTPVAIRNISLGGFSIDLDIPLKVGSIYPCTLVMAGRTVRVDARVTERSFRPEVGSHRIGLAFRCLTQRERTAVENLTGSMLGFAPAPGRSH